MFANRIHGCDESSLGGGSNFLIKGQISRLELLFEITKRVIYAMRVVVFNEEMCLLNRVRDV